MGVVALAGKGRRAGVFSRFSFHNRARASLRGTRAPPEGVVRVRPWAHPGGRCPDWLAVAVAECDVRELCQDTTQIATALEIVCRCVSINYSHT